MEELIPKNLDNIGSKCLYWTCNWWTTVYQTLAINGNCHQTGNNY